MEILPEKPRIVRVIFDPRTDKSRVDTTSHSIEEILDILCKGMVSVLRAARKKGDTAAMTAERLAIIRTRIWVSIIDKYDMSDEVRTNDMKGKPLPPIDGPIDFTIPPPSSFRQ